MKLPVEGTPLLPPDIAAPEKQLLTYRSHPRLFAIPPTATAAEGEFEGLYLCERHVHRHGANLPPYIGDYTISIEGGVESSGQLLEVGSKLGAMTADLDRFFVYACGEPLLPVGFSFSFDSTPNGWQSNRDDLKDYFLQHCTKTIAVVRVTNQKWISMPYFPLRPALEARDRFKSADTITAALVDLHYGALKVPIGEGRLFSLARGLELARKVIPGNDDDAKEKNLALPVGALKRSLHWLFDVGNNRYNTRHVVKRGAPAAVLHPRMTGEELTDYQSDADYVLRKLICDRLKILCPNLQPAGPSMETQQSQHTEGAS